MRKISFLIWFFLILVAFILLSVRGCMVSSDRYAPKLERTMQIGGLKGEIASADGYTLVSSKRSYRAQIDLRSLDFSKLDYFLKLYQIYSFAPDRELAVIKRRLLAAKSRGAGNFVLSNELDERAANYLFELSRKLYTQGFFGPFRAANGNVLTSGLDVIENKEQRIFSKGDILTPVLGYSTYAGESQPIARKGLERFYADCLSASSDFILRGARDIGRHIIISRHSFLSERLDGCKLTLSINLKLQKALENIATSAQQSYGAKQIIIALMRAKDAQLVALATSKRYDPDNRPADLSYLNTDAVEFSYEPGSVIKPIIYANLLALNRLQPSEWINTHNGRLKLDKFTITDTHPAARLQAQDVIVKSSNIGMVELSGRESTAELLEGLRQFGFGAPTGVDLPYEAAGWLKDAAKTYEIEKNSMAYGYGFRATFMQLLAAYNVFSAQGIWRQPRIGATYELAGARQAVPREEPRSVLAASVAEQLRSLLITTANQKSTARYWPEGISVGGKTGTARISARGGYSREYNANFFGFADDGANAYTVGVLVMSPDASKRGYYAAQTALPVAASAIYELLNNGYLRANLPAE